MANFLASNEFTFVHPSSNLLVGAASGYNLDFHGPQNVFSPINCTLPTTIQFPTPPVTSHPQHGGCFGSRRAEAAISMTSALNFACMTWQPPVNLYPQPMVPSCMEALPAAVSPELSTLLSNAAFGSTWSDKLSYSAPQHVGGCKRKAEDFPEGGWLPAKVRINEERMSACMRHLHLDNNNSGTQQNFEGEPWYSQDVKTGASVGELEELESVDLVPDSSSAGSGDANGKLALNKNSKIEFSRELELGLKSKEILPKVILDELVKSSMQVVLWKPPELFGQQLLTEISNCTSKTAEDETSNAEEDEMLSEPSASDLPTFKSCPDLVTFQPWAVLPETSSLATGSRIDLSDDSEDMDL